MVVSQTYLVAQITVEQISLNLADEINGLIFPTREKFSLHTRKTSNGSNFGWLIRQMSINQKSGRQTFRRRFVPGSLFVSPSPPECNFQSETKIQPDLRLRLGAYSNKYGIY